MFLFCGCPDSKTLIFGNPHIGTIVGYGIWPQFRASFAPQAKQAGDISSQASRAPVKFLVSPKDMDPTYRLQTLVGPMVYSPDIESYVHHEHAATIHGIHCSSCSHRVYTWA